MANFKKEEKSRKVNEKEKGDIWENGSSREEEREEEGEGGTLGIPLRVLCQKYLVEGIKALLRIRSSRSE